MRLPACGSRLPRIPLLLTLLWVPAACSDLVDTTDPDLILPGDLESRQGAEALYNGAIGDLSVALVGNSENGAVGLVLAGALLSDEFWSSSTPPAVVEMDTRSLQEQTGLWPATYANLHRVRQAAARGTALLRDLSANPQADPRIGELYAIRALVYVLFAEHYCSGVPFSDFEPDVVYGPPLTTEEMLQRALALADSADQFAAGSAEVEDLAAVVRGRARLDLGDFAGAAAAVAGVPTDFVYQTFHSTATPRQLNFIWLLNHESGRYSVATQEGTTGLDFATAGDPRVPAEFAGLGQDSKTDLYLYGNYDGPTDPVPLATGVEARLMEAEADLQAGDAAGWLSTLNQLRAGMGLGGLADPGTATGREDLHFRERAFWLFATGHRVGDLRRLIRQYGRNAESVFPTGPYHKENLTYGDAVNIVIPQEERNNPMFAGCLDRDA